MPSICKVYPEQLPNRIRSDPKRSAEVRLYDLFKSQLGSGWVVFYSVAWLGRTSGNAPRDGETDFVVAHPARGVLLIEVKGGRIRYDGSQRQWISTDREGIDHFIDPFEQVRTSKHALLNKLKALPAWQHKWIDLGHSVAFPNQERPRQAITPDALPEIIIGADDLDKLADRVVDILNYYRSTSSHKIEDGSHLVADLTKLIAPTTELRNPLSLQTAEDDREIVRLTEEQFHLLRFLSRRRRVAIGGCAGAGKTFLATEKAKQLAREGFRTLLTCYNRPLADHLALVTAGTENLEVLGFHQLCYRFAKEAGLSMPTANDHVFQEQYPDLLLQAASLLTDRLYDAIIVDEGQDFRDDT